MSVTRVVPLLLCAFVACADDDPITFTAVTFNTGTTENMGSDDHVDGYSEAHELVSDAHYGNGLAWLPAVRAAEAFFAELQPDVVAFQEIFHPGDCPLVPEADRVGFVCEDWAEGDPTVAQVILGAGYQVACNLGKPDKCIAVGRAFGTIRGCDGDLCLDGLAGGRVPDCGGGSRVGRAEVELVDEAGLATGDVLTVVSMHGSSGFGTEDFGCREQQFEQVFVDLLDGSGMPGANGSMNLVLGDFNTDPGRAMRIDSSAQRLLDLAEEFGFSFLTEVGRGAPGTYAGAVDIDHVLSDAFSGTCIAPGVTDPNRVYGPPYFDHVPIVCALQER